MSVTEVSVIGFKDNEVEGQRSALPADRVLAGAPEQVLWNHFQDRSKQMVSGVWDCSPGKWTADYSTKSEFCHILSGKVILADTAGKSQTFSSGDSFVIPSGFEGTWEVVEPVRKLYVIFQPN
ncbi:MAG TPA: cupin domain-containing protein [Guyparkeria sp.]|nr:cupin domain-containing protein [Guyparkeria sp.]